MSIRFVCPYGHRLKSADHRAGKKGRCPICYQRIIVPVPNPQPSGREKRAWDAAPDDGIESDETPIPAPAPLPSTPPAPDLPLYCGPDGLAWLNENAGPLDEEMVLSVIQPPPPIIPAEAPPKIVKAKQEKPPGAAPPRDRNGEPPPPAPRPGPAFPSGEKPQAPAPAPSDSVGQFAVPRPSNESPGSIALRTPPPPAAPPPRVTPPPVAADRSSGAAGAGLRRPAAPPTRWLARPHESLVDYCYRPNPQQVETVYWLAAVLMFAAVFCAAPALKHIGLVDAPAWAQIMLIAAGLQLAYVGWLALLPDWSTLRVGMWLFAACAAVYGLAAGILLAGDDVPFGLAAMRSSSSAWCGANLLVLSLTAYACGRQSLSWQRSDAFIGMALGVRRQASG